MITKEEIISGILEREGGYVNDPNDSGGATRYGITVNVARAFGYTGDMRALPLDVAVDIYKKNYWNAMRLDDIYSKSPMIAEELFDTGVNMGIGRAGEFLQRAINVLTSDESLKVDGQIGQKTIFAFYRYLERKNSFNACEKVLFRMLNSLQGDFYITLAERRVKDEKFVFGWFLNRVS